MTPETIISAPIGGFTETTIIVIAVCATIVLLSLVFFVRKFKISTDKEGMSLDIGSSPQIEADNHTNDSDKQIT